MVGSTIQAIFGDFRQFVDDHFLSPPALLIAIGFILIFVATLGAYGAIKESVMLINMVSREFLILFLKNILKFIDLFFPQYGVCLFLVFILEVSASIAAFVMQGQVREMLIRTLNQSMADYESNEYIQAGVDFMQSGLECCGVDGPKDWAKYMNQSSNSLEDEVSVPYSCCGRFNIDDITKCDLQYENGCYARMDFIISQSTMLIATGATTVAFVQVSKELDLDWLKNTQKY